ncbi:MAG: hypothetical protein AAGL69_04840 [Pseudomonadota bacterium]
MSFDFINDTGGAQRESAQHPPTSIDRNSRSAGGLCYEYGIALAALLLLTPSAQAEHDHHLSLLLGSTELVDSGATGFTYGFDYEYAISRELGVGFVLERAEGDVSSTALFAVADVHITEPLVVQLGPGFEWGEEEDALAFRLGGYYEFDLGQNTLAATVSYDFADSEDDSIVIGFLIGFQL